MNGEELIVVWRCLREMILAVETQPVTGAADGSCILKPSFIQVYLAVFICHWVL